MMRLVILTGVTLFLCAGSQAYRAKPVFAFMGDNTDARTARTTLSGKPCIVTDRVVDKKKGRKMECGPSEQILWNGERLNFVSMTYWNGRLIRAVGAFDRARYRQVLVSLTNAYGKPQRSGYQTMAERPDPFTYPETVWEFADGQLALESQIDESAVLTFGFSVGSPPNIDDVIIVPVR